MADHLSVDRRRAAVLKAATALFLEQGYDRTSLEQVIEHAGGSRRTIYQQFGSKEGLFVAVVEAVLESLLESLSMQARQQEAIESVLVRAGTTFVQALTKPENLAIFRLLITEVGRFPSLGRTFYHNGPELAYQKMSEYLQQQTLVGKLQVSEPDLAARQLIEMMKGDLHLRALLCPDELPTKEQIEMHVRSAVNTFLQGTYSSDLASNRRHSRESSLDV